MLCGFTITEYIRNRRLALAAEELTCGAPVIDTAVNYGYDSPDSFAKAFYRFHGVTPSTARDVNVKIFSEWLPALKDHEIAAGYCIEMYDDPGKYPKGVGDENYYTEIWIPVKKK